MRNCVFCPQVSWLRSSDSQVLSAGWTKFVGDRRFMVFPAERSHTWGLEIRNVTPADTGLYFCQVNTEPKISLDFHLTVTGTRRVVAKSEGIAGTTIHSRRQ